MKYFSLIWSALFRSKTRTLLTLLSVVAAFLLFGLLDSVRVAFNSGGSVAGADRLVVASRLSITQMLPYSLLTRIESTPGVKKATYAAWFGGIYKDPKNFFPNFSVGPGYLDMYPEYIVDPAQVKAWEADRTGAIVGENLAKRFGWKIGETIPLQATIIPVYYMITRMHLYDTLLALILPSVAFAVPITVLILVNFVRDVPKELFESMRVDGAGDWRMLGQLVLPLARPAIITVAIYDALNVWNGFLFPLVLTQSTSTRVLPLSLWTYQGEFQTDTPAVLAAVVLSALPIVVAYVLGRRQLVSGLTAGFGK